MSGIMKAVLSISIPVVPAQIGELLPHRWPPA
jgi:hypothetical protein